MSSVRTTIASFALAVALGGGAAFAEEMKMQAELTGAKQVPPVETSGKGMTEVTYDSDTGKLSWTLEYSDLSSDVTAAHFHGPAHADETAPPVVPIEEFASGSEGSAEITAEQAKELMQGHFYVNVHTTNNPNGEIRGQVVMASD